MKTVSRSSIAAITLVSTLALFIAGQRAHAKSQADFDQDDDIEPGRHKPAKRAAQNPSTGRKRAM